MKSLNRNACQPLFVGLLLLVCATLAHAQGIRWDLGAPGSAGAVTTIGSSGSSPLVALPGVQLNWCNYPANAVPCTNFATTYTSLALSTPCASNAQVVLQGSNSCQATGDNFGNMGVYTATNTACSGLTCYAYTLTVNGVSSGPYLWMPGAGGNSASNPTVFNVLTYGAKCDGSTDDSAAFASALTAMTNGGILFVPPSASGCKLLSSLTISLNGVTLQGAGWNYGANQAPSTLLFAAGVNGVIASGNAFAIKNLVVKSLDSGANSDVGVHFTGGRPYAEQVTVWNFGGPGFDWDSTGAKNVDHWYAAALRALSNFGDGFLFVGGTDTNAGTGINMDASLNGGIGFNLSSSGVNENTFIGPLAATNTGGDYVLSGSSSSNYFLNAYCESGTGSSFVIGASSVFNQVIFPNFGLCATITNSGGISNNIYFQYSSSAGVNNVVLNPPPGTAVGSGVSYQLSSGNSNPKDFDLRDVTDTTDLLYYEHNIQSGSWHFLRPLFATNFAGATSAGSTNSQYTGYFASCWNGSTAQNDYFTVQQIGGSGTNGTETVTHTHVPGCTGYTSELFQYPIGGKKLIQTAANDFAGSCAMSAGTTCTFSLNQAFQGTPLTFVSIDAASVPPATAISAKCAISSTTVTITAGVSNSLTWDCLLIGNPN